MKTDLPQDLADIQDSVMRVEIDELTVKLGKMERTVTKERKLAAHFKAEMTQLRTQNKDY